MTRCWYASNSPARIIRQPIRRCAPPATRFPSVKLPETRTSYDAVLVETEQERRTTRPRGAFFSENARLTFSVVVEVKLPYINPQYQIQS